MLFAVNIVLTFEIDAPTKEHALAEAGDLAQGLQLYHSGGEEVCTKGTVVESSIVPLETLQ